MSNRQIQFHGERVETACWQDVRVDVEDTNFDKRDMCLVSAACVRCYASATPQLVTPGTDLTMTANQLRTPEFCVPDSRVPDDIAAELRAKRGRPEILDPRWVAPPPPEPVVCPFPTPTTPTTEQAVTPANAPEPATIDPWFNFSDRDLGFRA